MLTREEIKIWYDCYHAKTTENCQNCLLGKEGKYGIMVCSYDETDIENSHIASLDEINRLTAELAAVKVGHETTKRTLVGNIDDFGAISQCEKCYKMLDVFMKFCPNCGRKIEGSEK